ncbi:NACHT, LRR and PYD domains-containing protein 5 [Saguinus oedipus]|uniref:NACHT, LRR and PYD domains-containing protein 5 n=1 Tax=Saguinus oedipus TaxID=9490 RepID=A0ABQ9TXE3_SAGOE|nr:NACHT, LRR and PYD domains-containing protein 5 [Saguinus oedipus]
MELEEHTSSHSLGFSSCRLQDCGITATGCRSLASALVTSHSLTHLCLSNNNLGNEGVSLLCRSLRLPHCGLQRLIVVQLSEQKAGMGSVDLIT